MRKTMPYIDFIYICDYLFLPRRMDEIRDFAAQYREKFGIPFMCCTDPLSLTEEKLHILAEAGMVGIQMGSDHLHCPLSRGKVDSEDTAPYSFAGCFFTELLQYM